ncbi:RTA1-like protein [Lentinula lateritia]|nr:RTA1-like protein [Lentinula lateritia]
MSSDSSLLEHPYNYTPTEYVTILFFVLFSVSFALHTGQAVYFRTWWTIPTMVFAGLLEVLGWNARLWSSKSPSLSFSIRDADLTSLLAQAVGGGMAATAVGKGKNPTPGGHVMLGGIVFQMATITIYILCASEFFIRYFNDKPLNLHRDSGDRGAMDFKLEIMSAALLLSTICIFIRAVYRTIELTDGWSGRIISTQRYFNVLDGAMIVSQCTS